MTKKLPRSIKNRCVLSVEKESSSHLPFHRPLNSGIFIPLKIIFQKAPANSHIGLSVEKSFHALQGATVSLCEVACCRHYCRFKTGKTECY
jgi:hypothetical protein